MTLDSSMEEAVIKRKVVSLHVILTLDRELGTSYEEEIRSLIRSNAPPSPAEDSDAILNEFFVKLAKSWDEAVDFCESMRKAGRMKPDIKDTMKLLAWRILREDRRLPTDVRKALYNQPQ